MGLVPSSTARPTAAGISVGPDGRIIKSAYSNGVCAASFTSTEMDVVTMNGGKVETDKDREEARCRPEGAARRARRAPRAGP